jgi:hypothetical protein
MESAVDYNGNSIEKKNREEIVGGENYGEKKPHDVALVSQSYRTVCGSICPCTFVG